MKWFSFTFTVDSIIVASLCMCFDSNCLFIHRNIYTITNHFLSFCRHTPNC